MKKGAQFGNLTTTRIRKAGRKELQVELSQLTNLGQSITTDELLSDLPEGPFRHIRHTELRWNTRHHYGHQAPI